MQVWSYTSKVDTEIGSRNIYEWLKESNSINENTTIEDLYWPKMGYNEYKAYVNLKVDNLVDIKEAELKASKFWDIVFLDEISNYEKNMDIKFLNLLIDWTLSIKTLGYNLYGNSVLQVEWKNGNVEWMKLDRFIKYLWVLDSRVKIEDSFMEIINYYNINYEEKSTDEKINEINYFWRNKIKRAA